MKSKEEHKIKLREISDLAFSYGINAIFPHVKKIRFQILGVRKL